MPDLLKTTSTEVWSGAQAATLVVVCLLAGTAGGWLLRSSSTTPAVPQTEVASAPAPLASQPAPPNFGLESSLPSNEQLKQAADSQAAPILEQLKKDPNNARLLASVGNLYYDAKEYPTAIEYYKRSLKTQPTDTSVRTDLGTAYWYTGNADSAIAEFNKALSYDPTKADTLFNLGIVKWQGKKDVPGAVVAWQKLLDANPGYPNKDGVLHLMMQAQQH